MIDSNENPIVDFLLRNTNLSYVQIITKDRPIDAFFTSYYNSSIKLTPDQIDYLLQNSDLNEKYYGIGNKGITPLQLAIYYEERFNYSKSHRYYYGWKW